MADKDFADIWRLIQQDEYEYYKPDVGVHDTVYITEDFVFEEIDRGHDGTWVSSFVVEELYNRGANVPEMLYRSKSQDIVVFERVKGDLLQDISNADRGMGKAVGATLRAIHGPSYRTFGPITVDGGVLNGRFSDVSEYVEFVIQQTDEFIHEGSSFREYFEYSLERVRESGDMPVEASFCHFDYSGDNIIYNGEKAYAIDFDNCELGFSGSDVVHAHLNINQESSEEFEKGFFEGYGEELDDLSVIERAFGVMRSSSHGAFRERRGEEPSVQKYSIDQFLNEWL